MHLFEYTRVFPDAAERRGELRPPAPGVLENFKEGKPKTYPSTLRVRVSATRRPDRVKVTHRPQHVLQREVGQTIMFGVLARKVLSKPAFGACAGR